jgi:uncharacterized protein
MRLDPKEIETLKSSLRQLDRNVRIYLFGSRADDNEKGGDIDLLVISRKLDKKSIRPLKHKFYENFGEQKIDIIIDDDELNGPFVKKIYRVAVSL